MADEKTAPEHHLKDANVSTEAETPEKEEAKKVTIGDKIKAAAHEAIPSGKNADASKLVEKGEKTLAALGYISFLCVLPLALKPESDYCQFHGKQSLVILIFFLLLSWIGWFIFLIGILITFVQIIIVILGIMNASKGRKWRIPFIAQIADKLEW